MVILIGFVQKKCSLLATKSIRITQTMINGVRLKSIQLKETVFDGHVADKMERLHGPHRTNPIQFLRQMPWLRSVAKGRRKA